MIRSIYVKAIFGLTAILLLALLAIVGTTTLFVSHRFGPESFIDRTITFELESALIALAEGGRPALARYLNRLNETYPGRHFLTDTDGQDVLDGTDRSELLAQARNRPGFFGSGEVVINRASGDGRFQFLVVMQPLGIVRAVLYFLWIPVGIVLACLFLARRLIQPIRRLQAAMKRFGSGDLSARSEMIRGDEIGHLAAEFDDMAERIERFVLAERQLFQDVSHELRSPLARLAFALELAENGVDQAAALEQARKEYRRMTDLVTELVELARAEGDPAAAQTLVVLLDELVREIIEDGAAEAAVRGCEIKASITAGLSVPGQPRLLHRAIENVLRNAIRFAPAQTKVEVIVQVQESGAQIRIRDHGPGLPAELLEAIFTPFFRVGEDRSRESGGVGLGLAIARRIILVHGGQIEARLSHPGLEVVIKLPRTSPPPDTPSTFAAADVS